MTIREFIELQMAIYNLRVDEKTFNKIKVKVTRELKKIESWFELKEKQTVGKTTAYILDEQTKNSLEIVLKPYLMKLANINPNEFEKEKQINLVKAKNIDSKYDLASDFEDSYSFSVPMLEKIGVMIEALFNEKYILDEKAWNEDYTNYRLFLTDTEALSSDSLAISNLRLRNPLKYYVKEK
ncbi:hypothetical protein HYO62_06045 [Aerococcaceae bacterium DSM 111022]|nr:hypothetical protein [Aerococcaceae bacterium DSM 111022]